MADVTEADHNIITFTDRIKPLQYHEAGGLHKRSSKPGGFPRHWPMR